MWSILNKLATKVAILNTLQLLAGTQQVYGVETRLADDVEGVFRDKPVTGQAWVGDTYYTLTEIGAYYDSLVRRYPDLVHKGQIGTSIGGKPIWAIHFTIGSRSSHTFFSTADDSKMKIWVQCLLHAREWVAGSACLYFSEALIQNYAETGRKAFRALFDTWDFIIIPVANPDGYEFTHSAHENRFWRMNRKPTEWNALLEKAFRSLYIMKKKKKMKGEVWDKKPSTPKQIPLPDKYPGPWSSTPRTDLTLFRNVMRAFMIRGFTYKYCIGVDLNRNFPYRWASEGRGATKYPCLDENYVGPSAGSERETAAIINHFKLQHPIMAAVDFHSYWQMIITPWGCHPRITCEQDLEMLKAGAIALQTGLRENGHVYGITDAFNLGGSSAVSGSFIDWAFSADVAAENKRRGQPYRTLPYSIELRPKMGTFKEQEFNRGFVVLPRNIEPIAWEASLGVWKLFLHVRQNYRKQEYRPM